MKNNQENIETPEIATPEGITDSSLLEYANNINTLSTQLENLIKEIQLYQQSKQEQEKEEEDLLKQKEEEDLLKQKEEEEKEQHLLEQFTILVENSDLEETMTYQETIVNRLDELILQNKVNYIFEGVLIAFCCVLIFQNHMKR